MLKLNTAVIGCGSWGRNHARVYSELPNIKLLSVVDIDARKAQDIGKKYNTEWSTNIDDVLTNLSIEAISICTPTVTHAKIVLRAIEEGKHVLVEKPMTNTLDEAMTLIKAAEKHGVYLSVGFVERFNPAVSKAMELILEGKIGDVLLAHTKRVSRRPLRIGDVGVIKDLGIHDIDIMNQLFKEESRRVFCTAGCVAHEFEDYANINIQYGGDKNAFIETNWLTPRKVRNLIITGSEGIIRVEYVTQELVMENNERMIQPFLKYEEPLYLELDNFTNSILKNEEPKVSGWDGYSALKICEAALKSAEKGDAIDMNPI